MRRSGGILAKVSNERRRETRSCRALIREESVENAGYNCSIHSTCVYNKARVLFHRSLIGILSERRGERKMTGDESGEKERESLSPSSYPRFEELNYSEKKR